MMNRKFRIRKCFCTAMVLFFGICGVWQGKLAEQQKGEFKLQYYAGQGVTKGELDRLLEQERKNSPGLLPDITAWRIEKGIGVLNPSLDRKTEADCITVNGDKSQVLKLPLTGGAYGLSSDEYACVISRSLAVELFGSVNVVGKQVKCQERYLTVRGIVNLKEPVILVTAHGSRQMFTSLLIDGSAAHQSITQVKNLLFRYEISREGVWTDGNLLAGAARLVCFLPLWVFWAASFGRWKRFTWKQPCQALWGLLLLAGVCLTGWISIELPPELIPGKWSDFDFWPQQLGYLKTYLWNLSFVTEGYGERMCLINFAACLICGLAASWFSLSLESS